MARDFDIDEIRRMVEQYSNVAIMRQVIVYLLEREEKLVDGLEKMTKKYNDVHRKYERNKSQTNKASYSSRAIKRIVEKVLGCNIDYFSESTFEKRLKEKIGEIKNARD